MPLKLLGSTLVLCSLLGINGARANSLPAPGSPPAASCFNPGEFDRQVQTQAPKTPDLRLLIVEINEPDIQQLGLWPLSDRIIASTLAELQRHRPAVIGLDLYRDRPVEPGRSALLAQLKQSNVVVIQSLGNATPGTAVSAPAGVKPDQVGFIDTLTDPDGIVRRQLLFASLSHGKSVASFAFQVATRYLSRVGVVPQASPQNPQHLQLGAVVLPPLERYCSNRVDLGGYQIPLHYRAAEKVARTVTLTQVVRRQVNPAWVRGKIVLIGITAPSLKDIFLTPYRDRRGAPLSQAGVVLQAQMISQLVTTALGE